MVAIIECINNSNNDNNENNGIGDNNGYCDYNSGRIYINVFTIYLYMVSNYCIYDIYTYNLYNLYIHAILGII